MLLFTFCFFFARESFCARHAALPSVVCFFLMHISRCGLVIDTQEYHNGNRSDLEDNSCRATTCTGPHEIHARQATNGTKHTQWLSMY